jgi:hypothetical protein
MTCCFPDFITDLIDLQIKFNILFLGKPIFTLLDSVRENSSSVPVRLVGGKTPREGRLQVTKKARSFSCQTNFN